MRRKKKKMMIIKEKKRKRKKQYQLVMEPKPVYMSLIRTKRKLKHLASIKRP